MFTLKNTVMFFHFVGQENVSLISTLRYLKSEFFPLFLGVFVIRNLYNLTKKGVSLTRAVK